MRWLELASHVDSEATEAVSEVFSQVAAGGVSVEPDLIAGADDGYSVGPEATVRAYLPLDDASPAKTRKIEEALWHLRAIWPVGDLQVREIAEEDWATAWKAHYTTFRIGRRVIIRPSWLDYEPKSDDIVISLDPGAAFGTGLHPTTRRCVEALEEIVLPGNTVLDVGTGSGILALAAVGLGAAHVDAVDVDPIAVDSARANVAVNGAEAQIQVGLGSVDATGLPAQYDIVVANIIARVILALSPQLAAHVKPSGFLVAGGVIAERADEVDAALRRLGFSIQRFQDGDWVTFLANRIGE